jgi:hypothetical protein
MSKPSAITIAAAANCAVASHALVEAPLSTIAALRDQPPPAGAPSLPSRFLRHCDEQTVVGMRAVLEAIARHPEPRPAFDRYGVIGSSCAAGRISAAQTLAQLKTGGAVVVSPHIVPQCSLHAPASAVSVALGMHGPTIGSSGGPHALSEGLFTAFSLLQNAACAGIWLVVTEWDEEPRLDASGKPLDDPLCRALAIALVPAGDAAAALTLHLHRHAEIEAHAGQEAQSLASFARAIAMCAAGGVLASWSHACPWGAEIRVLAREAAQSTQAAFRREAA